LIETVMLRSLKQAQYIEANEGHFGLAYSAYTHFTSPIRRYADIMVHRLLVVAETNTNININVKYFILLFPPRLIFHVWAYEIFEFLNH